MSFSSGIRYRKSFLFIILFSSILNHRFSYAKVLTSGALSFYLEHSDNVFSSPASTAVGGITYLITPSATLSIPGRKIRYSLSYSYSYEKNTVNNDNEESNELAITPNLTPVSNQGGYERQYHSVNANMGLDMTRKVSVNVTGSYNINFQSVRPGQVLNFAPNEQTRTDISTIASTLLWTPTKKIRNDLSISKADTVYDNPTVADMSTTTLTYTMAYDLLRWLQVGAGVKYSKNDYDVTGLDDGGNNQVGDGSLLAPNAPLDINVMNYNLTINADLKYFVIGLSYGMLQTRTRGKSVTTFSAGGLPLFVTRQRGSGILKSLTSVFSVNIAANPKTFKIKNFNVEVNSNQQFNVDLAGQGYISRTLGIGVGYGWKSVMANLSITRNQDRYINNSNQTLGTAGSFSLVWQISRKTAINFTGTRTKYEFESDADSGLVAMVGLGPTSFPQGQPTSIVQEGYIDITHSWTKWLTSSISFGRREGESISSFTVVGSDLSQSIDTGYIENLVTFSTMATF